MLYFPWVSLEITSACASTRQEVVNELAAELGVTGDAADVEDVDSLSDSDNQQRVSNKKAGVMNVDTAGKQPGPSQVQSPGGGGTSAAPRKVEGSSRRSASTGAGRSSSRSGPARDHQDGEDAGRLEIQTDTCDICVASSRKALSKHVRKLAFSSIVHQHFL